MRALDIFFVLEREDLDVSPLASSPLSAVIDFFVDLFDLPEHIAIAKEIASGYVRKWNEPPYTHFIFYTDVCLGM